MFNTLLRKFKRCRAVVVFAINGKCVTLEKGTFATEANRELTDILVKHANAGPGEIHILANDRLDIEGNIPASCHQGIRNVVSMYL